ncbi:hypothetical protein GKC30_08045 [Pseudodesulfovibrio sp. F-1]|uniref:Uncharacterized protein n=1 Tax=Pseudodesulfovibrio alkaliphilus TaxID=2661613 RepID=A0A7K1KNK1_9BACT|nr:hypothetical protein [Pseudodesulfovibrio alkaliphilus]MUM77580.1 hypothetical protein [Pseudodesulfovibrio alkaliphilus]
MKISRNFFDSIPQNSGEAKRSGAVFRDKSIDLRAYFGHDAIPVENTVKFG